MTKRMTRRGALTMTMGVFPLIGLSIAGTPAKVTLFWDRSTGYYIYKRTLKSTKSQKKALHKAELFYKIFGFCFAAFSIMSSFLILLWSDETTFERENKDI